MCKLYIGFDSYLGGYNHSGAQLNCENRVADRAGFDMVAQAA